MVLLGLGFGARAQHLADGVAEVPLGAAGGAAQREEPARWALGFEVGQPFAVELVGELVQWLHLIPLGSCPAERRLVWVQCAGAGGVCLAL